MPKRSSQLQFFNKSKNEYGGALRQKRAGRVGPRPVSTQHSMHLVLRSSKAKDEWSFLRPKNKEKIKEIVARFARKHSVHVKRMEDVGNHLHLHIQLASRYTFRAFIRAITGAIAMAVTGAHRWKTLKSMCAGKSKAALRFWDLRPFTRIVIGMRAALGLQKYFDINALEAIGNRREMAEVIAQDKDFWLGPYPT